MTATAKKVVNEAIGAWQHMKCDHTKFPWMVDGFAVNSFGGSSLLVKNKKYCICYNMVSSL